MNNIRWLEWIDINVTDTCNLSCSFCPRSDPEVWPNQNIHMKPEMFLKITDDLIKHNYTKRLSLTGRGESTLTPHWNELVEIINRPDKTWCSHVTTNGTTLRKTWDSIRKFDEAVINTYINDKDEYKRRRETYPTLDNGRNVWHKFKPDLGDDVTLVDVMEMSEAEMLRTIGFIPNNRAGIASKKVEHGICTRPINYIFINFDGTYELCCNDWNYQTPMGNVWKHDIIEIYLLSRKLNAIRGDLMKGDRSCTQACSECDAENFHDYVEKGVAADKSLLQRFERAKKLL